MRWTIPLGRLFGIRIELHVTFLLFIGWIAVEQGLLRGELAAALDAVLLLLLVFACVLLHELGHALAARRYGIATRDIVLLPIGGVARLTRMPDKPAQEIVVALAGPAVNVGIGLLLALVLYGTGQPIVTPRLSGGPLEALLLVNGLMVLFNMIPAFPMDGGRVLRALLAMAMPYAKATRIAAGVGQSIALVLGVVGLLNHMPTLPIIALFVFLAAGEERTAAQTRVSLAGVPVEAAMLKEFHHLTVHDPLRRAAEHLMRGSQQDFPVLDGDQLVGVLTRDELVRALQSRGADLPVGEVVRHDGPRANADEPLDGAVARMRANGRSALPVVRDGRLVGLLTIENIGDLLLVRDALRRFADGRRSA